MVSRFELLTKLSSIIPEDTFVVACIGNNSGFWGQLRQREADLFHITMGMCTPTALGLALALPNRKVVALDGDGNLLLNLGTLGTVANQGPSNLTIIVFDNGNYLGSHKEETGMPTASSGKLNFEGVARASGVESACTVRTVEEFQRKVQAALSEKGPHFIAAKVDPLDNQRPPKTRRLPDPRENKYRFANYVERTERVEILGGGLGKFS
jgi:thiamine pyrophosphate-dependent acetolactate synthase large subunit-like protein